MNRQETYYSINNIPVREGDVLRGREPYEASSEYPYYVVKFNNKVQKFELQELTGLKYTIPFSWIKNCDLVGVLDEEGNIILDK